METNQTESIESLARKYLLKSGSNYISILSDMKKKGYDEKTTMKVFERYEILRSNRTDRKTMLIKANDDKRLEINTTASERDKIIASIIGFICFITSFVSSFAIISTIILLIGSCAIGYLLDKARPLAGVVGFFVFFMLIGYSMSTYMEDRTTILKIEMAIPMLLAALPAYGIYYVIYTINKQF